MRIHRFNVIFFLIMSSMLVTRAAGILDPHTTVLPCYQLPASAAVDGKLDEWAQVPVSDDQIILCNGKTQVATVAPSDNFAASMRCGRVAGGVDLYFLIVVKDNLLLSPVGGWWVDPDYMELYFDFARSRRAAENPTWYTTDYHYPPEMGQFGFRPSSVDSTAKLFVNPHCKDWKVDYACVPIESGVAYEVRLDVKSVLDSLKMTELPPLLGIDVGFGDKDCPVTYQVKEWTNAGIFYRFFGNFLSHVTTVNYAGLATTPQPLPHSKAAPIKTLAELYGMHPTTKQVLKGIKKLPDAKLADLLRWAVNQGVPLNTTLVKPLYAASRPRAQETGLLALYYHREDADAVRLAVTQTYAHTTQATPMALTLANLLNLEMKMNILDPLPALLSHEDLGVFVSAARALAQFGSAADAKTLIATRDTLLTKLSARPDADSVEVKQRKAVYEEQFKQSLEELAKHTAPQQ